MKKYILVLFISCFYFLSASAQIEKKAIYTELSVGRKIFNYNTNGFQTGVSIGLNSHSTFGVFYGHTHYENNPMFSQNGWSNVNSYGVSYTYYSYFKNSHKWGWSLNGSASINRVHSYYKPAGGTATYLKGTDKDLAVTPGIFFKPSSRVMLTANIGGFSIYNSRYGLGQSHSSFGGELNLGIRIKLFGKKK